MNAKVPLRNNLNEWFESAVKEKVVKKIQFKELELDEEEINGGKGELTFARYKKDQKRVVIKKVTATGNCADRKQHFIYEVSIKPLFH